jgi:hypothetical protein
MNGLLFGAILIAAGVLAYLPTLLIDPGGKT